MRYRPVAVLAAAACLVAPTLAGGALDPAVKCHAAKLKLSGKYAACRLLEDAAATKTGTTPDYTTCDAKLQAGWAKVEASLATDCPTAGDLPDVQDSLVECVGASRWLVTFQATTSSSDIGALQFDVDYGLADGEFPGTISGVVCQNHVEGALFAKSDYDDTETLVIGVISLDGFATPQVIARCMFEANGVTAPVPSQFPIVVTDATDTNGNAISVTLAVTIDQAP